MKLARSQTVEGCSDWHRAEFQTCRWIIGLEEGGGANGIQRRSLGPTCPGTSWTVQWIPVQKEGFNEGIVVG